MRAEGHPLQVPDNLLEVLEAVLFQLGLFGLIAVAAVLAR